LPFALRWPAAAARPADRPSPSGRLHNPTVSAMGRESPPSEHCSGERSPPISDASAWRPRPSRATRRTETLRSTKRSTGSSSTSPSSRCPSSSVRDSLTKLLRSWRPAATCASRPSRRTGRLQRVQSSAAAELRSPLGCAEHDDTPALSLRDAGGRDGQRPPRRRVAWFLVTESVCAYHGPRHGAVAEWLGRGLQSLVQRFESARRLSAGKSGPLRGP
jgi:hypothetical protein